MAKRRTYSYSTDNPITGKAGDQDLEAAGQQRLRAASEGRKPKKLPSYHMEYRLQQQLVKIGVPAEALKNPDTLARWAMTSDSPAAEKILDMAQNWKDNPDREMRTGGNIPEVTAELRKPIDEKEIAAVKDKTKQPQRLQQKLETRLQKVRAGLRPESGQFRAALTQSQILSSRQEPSPSKVLKPKSEQGQRLSRKIEGRLQRTRIGTSPESGKVRSALAQSKYLADRAPEPTVEDPADYIKRLGEEYSGREKAAAAEKDILARGTRLRREDLVAGRGGPRTPGTPNPERVTTRKLRRAPKATLATAMDLKLQEPGLMGKLRRGTAGASESLLGGMLGKGKARSVGAALAGPLAFLVPYLFLGGEVERRMSGSQAIDAMRAAHTPVSTEMALEQLKFSRHQQTADIRAAQDMAAQQAVLQRLSHPPLTAKESYIGPHYGETLAQKAGVSLTDLLALVG